MTAQENSAQQDLSWERICTLEDIPVLGARVVRIGGKPIALFRNSENKVFALLDRCPHRAGPLSQGIVHGSCVTCPLHDWVIDLATGEATGPDEGRTTRYPVRVTDTEIFLGVPASWLVATPGTEPEALALAQ